MAVMEEGLPNFDGDAPLAASVDRGPDGAVMMVPESLLAFVDEVK
jgi:hypothetical protein